MDMKKVKGVANFDSKFVTFDDGSVYIRFDFGNFYEWYERTDKYIFIFGCCRLQGPGRISWKL